jgi:hypothetical protein
MKTTEIEFCDAISIYAPNAKAESFILANIVIDAVEMIEWLSKKAEGGSERVRLDLKVKDTSGQFRFPQWGDAKPFATVNNWKPTPRPQEGDGDAF